MNFIKCNEFCELNNYNCLNAECKHYICSEADHNCCLISAAKGPQTLREIAPKIGKSYVTVKQIEDKALTKIKKKMNFEQD